MYPIAAGSEGKAATAMMRFKLTKKKFMTLPNGLFLTSNVMGVDYRPIFASEIWDKTTRQLQWETITNCGVDHRLCEVWRSREIFENAYLKLLLPIIAKKRGVFEVSVKLVSPLSQRKREGLSGQA